jgi:hypothetical protein
VEKLTNILAVALQSGDATHVVDKAVALARPFRARVEVLVNDAAVVRLLSAHCAAQAYEDVTLHSVARSDASHHESILRRVWSSRPDLLVKSPSADDSDWDLADESPAPVLLVRGEAWHAPARFAAAVDVSDEDQAALARSILHTAGFLALGTHGHLDILYSEREAHDEAVRMKRAVHLAQIVREFHVGCERLQIFSGEPGKRLPPLVAARRYDVLVLGESRSADHPHLVCDSVRNLMNATQGDVVLVKAPSLHAALGAGQASGWQQRANQV